MEQEWLQICPTVSKEASDYPKAVSQEANVHFDPSLDLIENFLVNIFARACFLSIYCATKTHSRQAVHKVEYHSNRHVHLKATSGFVPGRGIFIPRLLKILGYLPLHRAMILSVTIVRSPKEVA